MFTEGQLVRVINGYFKGHTGYIQRIEETGHQGQGLVFHVKLFDCNREQIIEAAHMRGA